MGPFTEKEAQNAFVLSLPHLFGDLASLGFAGVHLFLSTQSEIQHRAKHSDNMTKQIHYMFYKKKF